MSSREKLFWLCAGAALIVLVLSLVPSHYEICEVAEKTKEKDCASYQVVPFAAIKIGQLLDRAGVAVTALATIAIALFTLTLKRATDRLWDAGERQIGLAKKSVDIAERALVAGDRAFVFVTFGQSPLTDVKTQRIQAWNFTPVWNNAGNTPTRNMVNHISIRLSDEELPEDWDFPNTWPPTCHRMNASERR